MSDTFTQDRFEKEFGTEDFEVSIRCRKCGSHNIDLHLDEGHVYSEQTADSASLAIWCRDCKTTHTRYL